MQGYVMLARSGGQGGGRSLAGRGVSPPRLFLSGVAWGELNGPDEDVKGLTLEQIPVILSDKQKNTRSNEQEEYIARHGYRESALVESRSGAAMEWACKL